MLRLSDGDWRRRTIMRVAAGSGVSGDILLTNGSASVGFVMLKFRKTSISRCGSIA